MSRVLVIDDESIVGVILRLALDAKGHETVVAEDGKTGIEMARAERPDAIVLDFMMPGVNGFACWAHFINLPSWMKCPSSS